MDLKIGDYRRRASLRSNPVRFPGYLPGKNGGESARLKDENVIAGGKSESQESRGPIPPRIRGPRRDGSGVVLRDNGSGWRSRLEQRRHRFH